MPSSDVHAPYLASVSEIGARLSTALLDVRPALASIASVQREVTRCHDAHAALQCDEHADETALAFSVNVDVRLAALTRQLAEAHAALAVLPVALREYRAACAPLLEQTAPPTP